MTDAIEDDAHYEIAIVQECDMIAMDEGLLRSAVAATFRRRHCDSARLSIALVDDSSIARLNAEYIGHEGPTDVISFDLADEEPTGVEGELVISVETACRQASARCHPPELEVLLYAVHGTLHLLGLDDATADEAMQMHRLEDDVLRAIGVGAVYSAKPS